MTYSVGLHPIAADQLNDVPARFRWRIARLINGLASDPHGTGKQMRDPLSKYYRVRLEKWRVVYEVIEEEQLVYIHRILLKAGPETYEDAGLE